MFKFVPHDEIVVKRVQSRWGKTLAMPTIEKGVFLLQASSKLLINKLEELNKVVVACHSPVLNGFDQHFQATVNFPLSSAID